MKLFNSSIVLLAVFCFLSCEKETDLLTATQEKTEKEVSEEELITQGLIPLEETVLFDYTTIDIESADNTVKATTKWSYSLMSESDLNAIYTSYTDLSFLKVRFKNVLNKGSRKPDGVSVNSFHVGSGTNTSTKYDWECYRYFTRKLSGSTTWENSGWEKVSSVNSIRIPNWTDSEVTHGNNSDYVSITRGEVDSWTVSASTSVTVGGKVGIPLVAEGSAEVTVSLGASYTDESSTTITVNPPTGWFNIPANTDAVLTLYQTTSTATTTYDVPIKVNGYVGASFGKKVDGHYYWAAAASQVFSEITDGSKNYQVTMVETEPAELKWFVNYESH